eukprot:TRINITY_DN14598_c0_g1_i6.p1 TRINITY_DN14598_c0_g1~~TRINITY_DN14598_c0_g1_i6.p1  ORF type:complete len:300 (-),score=109.06 TRINITY_DN14598_c0_g1_i6:445-1344(-)
MICFIRVRCISGKDVSVVAVFFFFFFQAEDGIRDAQESRGLGDVYKRQVSTQSTGDTDIAMTSRDQISRMKEFIMHEANQRVEEISDEAERSFTLDKQRMVENGHQKMREEFDRKDAAVVAQSKINRSKARSKARLECLESQDQALQKAFQAAAEQLRSLSTDHEMLVGLVLQAIGKLDEHKGTVYCREQDQAAVKKAVDAALSKHAGRTGESIELVLSQDKFIPDDEQSIGGVVVRSECGKIYCKNTFQSRLQIISEMCMPQIKDLLFPTSATFLGELDGRISSIMGSGQEPVDDLLY